jgi:hypothetical protein
MLQLFGFDRIGVVLGDIYWVDPDPTHHQGPEKGVRLEVRMMAPGELITPYSSRPITIAEPVWRLDLFEAADGPVGSLNHAHHHPQMTNWEPNGREFDQDMADDPIGWVGRKLADLEGLLAGAGMDVDADLAADADKLRASVPDVQRAVGDLLDRVKAGELGTPPDGEVSGARLSWL